MPDTVEVKGALSQECDPKGLGYEFKPDGSLVLGGYVLTAEDFATLRAASEVPQKSAKGK